MVLNFKGAFIIFIWILIGMEMKRAPAIRGENEWFHIPEKSNNGNFLFFTHAEYLWK